VTRPPRSLMAQILRWHAIAVLITAVAVAGGVYLFLDTTAARIQHQTVHVHTQALRQALSQDARGRLHLTQDGTSAAVFAAGAGFAFRIVDPRGAVLFRSDSPILVPLAAIPLSDEERFFRRQSRHAFYAGASSPVRVGSARVWIVVLQNLTHPDYILDDLLAQFLLYGLAIVTPVLLVLLAIDVLIIRRAVAPVRRASASLRTDDALPLDLRLHDDRLPAEVRPLARAVNALLERLTSSYRMQRDFIADAAHELRTPIAVARLRVEEVDDAASVDLVGIATDGVASIAPLAIRQGKSIALSTEADSVMVAGHAAWIAKALGCLIENAVKHSGPGRRIDVTIGTDGTLAVCDDGPGIPEADQPSIFRRFWKRDRAASASSGLGLAIVAQVAEAHATRVVLASRPGRTRFAITFRTALMRR
jgi:signal transduction histidine kinase